MKKWMLSLLLLCYPLGFTNILISMQKKDVTWPICSTDISPVVTQTPMLEDTRIKLCSPELPQSRAGFTQCCIEDQYGCRKKLESEGPIGPNFFLGLSQIPFLRKLGFWGIEFERGQLSKEIARCPLLTSLSILNCGTVKLPDNLGLPNLAYLSLRNTQVPELPNDMAFLMNLKVLDLSYTGLKSLPPLILLFPQLEKLDLSGLDEAAVCLRDLISAVDKLTWLSIVNHGNQIEKIKRLPHILTAVHAYKHELDQCSILLERCTSMPHTLDALMQNQVLKRTTLLIPRIPEDLQDINLNDENAAITITSIKNLLPFLSLPQLYMNLQALESVISSLRKINHQLSVIINTTQPYPDVLRPGALQSIPREQILRAVARMSEFDGADPQRDPILEEFFQINRIPRNDEGAKWFISLYLNELASHLHNVLNIIFSGQRLNHSATIQGIYSLFNMLTPTSYFHCGQLLCVLRNAHLLRNTGAGKRKNVGKLLNNGANANVQDPQGNTPLHIAIMQALRPISTTEALQQRHRAFSEMVRLLMLYGANPFIKNLEGNSPYDLACQAGDEYLALLTAFPYAQKKRDPRSTQTQPMEIDDLNQFFA